MNRFHLHLASVLLLAGAAFAQKPATQPVQPTQQTPSAKADKAAAYYHFAMAHMYEEQMMEYGRSDLATKAIEEFRAAVEADPSSEYLTSGLAELYDKTGRKHDAVLEVQDILKRDPNNLQAHKLLGSIYLRSLGEEQSSEGSQNTLHDAIEQYQEITKLEPNSVDDHLLLGRLYRLNNDLQKAENEFKTAVKLDPNSEEAVTTLAYLYNVEGDSTRAAQVLMSIPDVSRSAKLYSMLGSTYEQQKQYKEAIHAFRRAIELDRDNLDAMRGLAENLQNDGQDQAALDQYKIIAASNPEDAQTYAHMGEIYRKQGKYDLALTNLEKAQSMVPDLEEVSYDIATVYEIQGRYDDAVKILTGLLQKSDSSDGNLSQSDKNNRAIFLERLGTVYRDQNNDQLALATFRKMLALGDENEQRGYQEIIDTYRGAKQWQQATDAAHEATEKLPKDRGLKMVYAAQLADMGQPDKGLEEVKSLLKGDASDREIYISLAQMYSRLKRWPEAEQALDQAEKLSTKDDDKQYVEFLRGSTYERQKKYEKAEDTFRKILVAHPDDAATLNYLGYMMADRGEQLDSALGYIKKAVDLDPANSAYLDSLGWAYFKLGKYDLAEANLTKATQHMGDDPTVQEHLGDLYQKTGHLRLAATHWERALVEWNKTVSAEVDSDDVVKIQKKLETARVKLAKEESGSKQ
ncbi:MAG TPA: tetratricopeptide repeat protein [Terriglobales bacterium]|jgi:tetratricopeptide (TPR) repeat protein